MKRRMEPLDWAIITIGLITIALVVWSVVYKARQEARKLGHIEVDGQTWVPVAIYMEEGVAGSPRPTVPLLRNPKPVIDPRLTHQDLAMAEANKAGDHAEVARLLEEEAMNETPDYERPPDWVVKMRIENGWTNGVRVVEVGE